MKKRWLIVFKYIGNNKGEIGNLKRIGEFLVFIKI